VAPEVAKTVLSRLGITKINGIVAAYGDLIPGLAAGRWDMIGADLTISSTRCKQVLFADPITVDGASAAYLTHTPPTTLKAIGAAGMTVGMLQGSFLVAAAESKGISSGKILQFPDDTSAIDGLQAGRVTVVVSTTSGLAALLRQEPGRFKVGPEISDAGVDAASNAFATGDKSLYNAYQAQLRNIRADGTLDQILKKYGFQTPAKYKNLTVSQACAPSPA
jgi:polar amino acid transport system substrate-binding protein